jgi:drug/metabolite transporter (DMT)-like permease
VIGSLQAGALAWMALAALLFAFMNFFGRLASAHAHWAMVGCMRALVGALVAVVVARARGQELTIRDRRAMWLRSIFGTGSMTASFYALSSRTLALGDTASLLTLAPIFIALLAPIVLRERTGRSVAVALVLSAAGVLLIFRPPSLFGAAFGAASRLEHLSIAPAGPSAATTALVAVMSSFFAALAFMMLRLAGQRDSAEAISLHFSLFATAVLGAIALIAPASGHRGELLEFRAADLGFMVATGLAGGFAQLALTRAYSLDRAARVGAVAYISVVASALLGAAALHERPSGLAIAGMALVIAGGLVVTLAGRGAAGARAA